MAQQQAMSYAQALNEAKQIIIQQSSRIKADLEKSRGQQQTIAEQAARIGELEGRVQELSAELVRSAEELRALEQRYGHAEAGRQQAEGVVNRQGERINHLEAQVEELGRRLEAQANEIAGLRIERDEVRAQLPTSEDVDALNGMMTLLSQKRAGASERQPAMRIVAEAA